MPIIIVVIIYTFVNKTFSKISRTISAFIF
jgi:hypothetical protein